MITELFITEKVRVGDLVPNVKNPRKIKETEKNKLWERIQKYGMIGIPVRDTNGVLLSGHKRCEVIVQNGLGDMMVDVRTAVRELTDAELKDIMIIENSHAGEYDLDILKAEFESAIDLDSYGISLAELDQSLEETVKKTTEEPEMPIVRKFSEEYNSVVIICNDEIDFNHISEKLGLDRAKCYKSSKVGMTHVIDAKILIPLLAK